MAKKKAVTKVTKQSRIEAFLRKHPEATYGEIDGAVGSVATSQIATAKKRLGLSTGRKRRKKKAPAAEANGAMATKDLVAGVLALAEKTNNWERLEAAVAACKELEQKL